jgi:hypothetical protein
VCSRKRKIPGTTRSSLPTLHRRLKTTRPGMIGVYVLGQVTSQGQGWAEGGTSRHVAPTPESSGSNAGEMRSVPERAAPVDPLAASLHETDGTG